MKKHAYLIIANSNFLVQELAIRMIGDVRNDIYLLIDTKSHVSDELKDKLKLSAKYSRITVCSQLVNWAGDTLVDATLKLLALLLRVVRSMLTCMYFRVQIFRFFLRTRFMLFLKRIRAWNLWKLTVAEMRWLKEKIGTDISFAAIDISEKNVL